MRIISGLVHLLAPQPLAIAVLGDWAEERAGGRGAHGLRFAVEAICLLARAIAAEVRERWLTLMGVAFIGLCANFSVIFAIEWLFRGGSPPMCALIIFIPANGLCSGSVPALLVRRSPLLAPLTLSVFWFWAVNPWTMFDRGLSPGLVAFATLLNVGCITAPLAGGWLASRYR
jgi:hypothetical protein